MLEPRILINYKYTFADFTVQLVTDSNREIERKLEGLVDRAWQKEVEAQAALGKSIWDGTFYRLENLEEVERGSRLQNGQTILRLGTVDYRYIATFPYFSDYYLSHPVALPNHISTGGLIKTSDNHYVFGLRSQPSSGAVQPSLIGGGLQADELEVYSGGDLERNLLKEFKEEVNIDPDDIDDLYGIGAVYTATSNVIFFAYVELNVDRAELSDKFSQRKDDEMASLVFKHEGEVGNFLLSQSGYRPLLCELLLTNAG